MACVHARSIILLCLTLSDPAPQTDAFQASLFMKFSKQEYWSGLPFPISGDLLLNLGSETASSTCLVLQVNSLCWATTEGPVTQVCPSAEEYIKKMGYIHSEYIWIYICMYTTCIILYTYIGILFSHKKNEILPFVATWVGLENIMLSEISQMEKNKYCLIPFICGI